MTGPWATSWCPPALPGRSWYTPRVLARSQRHFHPGSAPPGPIITRGPGGGGVVTRRGSVKAVALLLLCPASSLCLDPSPSSPADSAGISALGWRWTAQVASAVPASRQVQRPGSGSGAPLEGAIVEAGIRWAQVALWRWRLAPELGHAARGCRMAGEGVLPGDDTPNGVTLSMGSWGQRWSVHCYQ